MKISYVTIVVNNMEESVNFYTETLGFTVDDVFDVPGGKLTLLEGEGSVSLGLVESEAFGSGIFSFAIDVDDIYKEVKNLTKKGANIALDIVETPVGYMARIVDPNGINIILIQNTR